MDRDSGVGKHTYMAIHVYVCLAHLYSTHTLQIDAQTLHDQTGFIYFLPKRRLCNLTPSSSIPRDFRLCSSSASCDTDTPVLFSDPAVEVNNNNKYIYIYIMLNIIINEDIAILNFHT